MICLLIFTKLINPSTSQHVLPSQYTEVEKKDTVLAKLGLDDWKFALPVGMFIAIPTLGNEVLVLDAETQLVACFTLFCATMYTQVGPMIGKSLDEYKDNVYETLKKVDEGMLVDIKASIAANEKSLDMEADIKSVHALIDDMAVAKADALNYEEEHKYRASVVQKLESLVAIEEQAVNAMKMRMLTEVKAKVAASFKDAATKDKALQAAMAVLTAGKGAKMGTDVVGDAYGAAIKSYRDAYSKQDPKADAILVQLEKDIAAACAPPTVSGEGGNVYEKFPVSG